MFCCTRTVLNKKAVLSLTCTYWCKYILLNDSRHSFCSEKKMFTMQRKGNNWQRSRFIKKRLTYQWLRAVPVVARPCLGLLGGPQARHAQQPPPSLAARWCRPASPPACRSPAGAAQLPLITEWLLAAKIVRNTIHRQFLLREYARQKPVNCALKVYKQFHFKLWINFGWLINSLILVPNISNITCYL